MTSTTVRRTLRASTGRVFAAVAEVEDLPDVIPDVVRIEFLSEQRSGIGTRFRETRVMRGKEAAMELEITEHDAPHRVRFVTDSHGTVWDSVSTVSQAGDGCER